MENTDYIIILANEIMLQFRIQSTEVKEYGYTLLKYESRLGIVDKRLGFKATTKMLAKALDLLTKEYKMKTSQLGIYYTVKYYTYS